MICNLIYICYLLDHAFEGLWGQPFLQLPLTGWRLEMKGRVGRWGRGDIELHLPRLRLNHFDSCRQFAEDEPFGVSPLDHLPSVPGQVKQPIQNCYSKSDFLYTIRLFPPRLSSSFLVLSSL